MEVKKQLCLSNIKTKKKQKRKEKNQPLTGGVAD
jgi:hypothetical protein